MTPVTLSITDTLWLCLERFAGVFPGIFVGLLVFGFGSHFQPSDLWFAWGTIAAVISICLISVARRRVERITPITGDIP